jgi:steroid delta-isomerase-like uncharacterized protein
MGAVADSDEEAVLNRSAAEVARGVIECLNTEDWVTLRSLYADDAYEEIPNPGPDGQELRGDGADAIVADARIWRRAFPDSRFVLDRVIAEEDRVALELTFEGTHTGPLPLWGEELAPSGRHRRLRLSEVMDIKDGKVQGSRVYYDYETWYQQLTGQLD